MKSAAPWLSVLSQLYGATMTCWGSYAEPCHAEENLVCWGYQNAVVKIRMELSVRDSGVLDVMACQEPSHNTRMSM